MIEEDVFEGWLSVPGIEGLLGTEGTRQHKRASIPSPVTSYHTRTASLERSETLPSDATCTELSARKRRGHKKSRLGCISCKRRKVKCQETWPSCANCIKLGFSCEYPAVFKYMQHGRVRSEAPTPQRYMQVSKSPLYHAYDGNDLRLFHHFMIAAHPCIPCEFEVIWIRDIPTFGHQYDYLMHGILAMAGSHLDLFTDHDKGHVALLHRQKAIRGLEDAFTRWPPSADEAHVMLATSYLLAFQSSYLSDGFLDHILSLRGCALLSQLILTNQLEGAFAVNPNMRESWLEQRMETFPGFDQELAREGLRSIAQLAPQVVASNGQEIERAIVAQIAEILRPLLVSTELQDPRRDTVQKPLKSNLPPASSKWTEHTFPPTGSSHTILKNPLFPAELALNFEDITCWETITEVSATQRPDPHRSFDALMASLLILTTWPQEQVLHLFSPANTLGSVVLAHFYCVRFISSPLWAPESAMRTIPVKAMVEWCGKVLDTVEDDDEVEWTKFVQWPQKILMTMRGCLDQNSGMTLGQVHDALYKDPAAFREGRSVQL